MPGLAMAANAGLLSTRSVRFVDFVLARSVTTTLAPAALQSFLSLHLTWKHAPQPTPPRYSAGPAAASRPPLRDAAAVPYPHEPAAISRQTQSESLALQQTQSESLALQPRQTG